MVVQKLSTLHGLKLRQKSELVFLVLLEYVLRKQKVYS